MAPFLWVVAIFDGLPAIFGGLLMLAAFRFSNGPRSSRAWRALLSIFGALFIVFAVLAFAFGALALWIGPMFPEEPPDPTTLLSYLWLTGLCSGPLLIGIALCASAFRIARRPTHGTVKSQVEVF